MRNKIGDGKAIRAKIVNRLGQIPPRYKREAQINIPAI